MLLMPKAVKPHKLYDKASRGQSPRHAGNLGNFVRKASFCAL